MAVAPRAGARRLRNAAAVLLLILGLVVGFAANITTWTKDVLLDTDEWVATVAPLPQDPEVADAVATLIVDELARDTSGLREEARAALPERAQFLAGPIASALETLVREEASKLIQSEEFNKLWSAANRLAHEQLVAVLLGDDADGLLETSDGEIRLDLSDAVAAVRSALGSDANALLGEPREGEGVVVIASSDQLAEAQDAVSILDTLGTALPVVAFVLLAASVAVAVSRRRALIAVGVGIAVAMAITLISLDVGRQVVIDLIPDTAVRLAGGQAYEIVVDNLSRQTWVIMLLGLLLAFGAWVVGPSRYAVSLRASVRRFALSIRGAAGMEEELDGVERRVREHRGLLQAAGVALALIALVLWNQPSFTTVIVVAVLLAVWLVALEVLAPRRSAARPGS